MTCGSPTSRTSNGGRSSPSLANDLWFTHMLNVQRWEVFASACDLWFTHSLNAFVNIYTNTVTRGSTARATHRAVPLPNRRRPPKVLVCLQTVHFLCPPFRTHAKGPFWKTMVFIRRWEVLTCGSPTIRTSNSGRSSPRLANDLWFTHLLNVQLWEVFASACDLWFTHALNAFVNTYLEFQSLKS